MKRTSLIACGAFAAMALMIACDPLAGVDDTAEPLYADNVVVVDGGVSTAVTWAAGSVYLVDGCVRVQNGATLTVERGAVVKFTALSVIDVEAGGRINATGAADAPIVFTSYRDSTAGGDSILNDGSSAPASGDWCGVAVESGSVGNDFAHCEFRYGGRENVPALKVSGTAAVDSCTFRDNLGGHPQDPGSDSATLDASDADSATTVTNCVFYRNRWPLGIAVTMSLGASNKFLFDEDGNGSIEDDEDNTHQAIFVNHGDITTNVAWLEADVPLCFFGNLVRVKQGITLTIDSDAVLKNSASDFQFENGVALEPVDGIFTSYRDDTRLGDTNADGDASVAEVGDWIGVEKLDINDNSEYVVSGDPDIDVRYSLYSTGD